MSVHFEQPAITSFLMAAHQLDEDRSIFLHRSDELKLRNAIHDLYYPRSRRFKALRILLIIWSIASVFVNFGAIVYTLYVFSVSQSDFKAFTVKALAQDILLSVWEVRIVWWCSLLELLCFVLMVCLHGYRTFLCKTDPLYVSHAILHLGKFNAFELLPLWNHESLYAHLRTLEKSDSHWTYLVVTQVLTFTLAFMAPVTLLFKFRRVITILAIKNWYRKLNLLANLFAIGYSFVGLVHSISPLEETRDVLHAMFIARSRGPIAGHGCMACALKQVRLDKMRAQFTFERVLVDQLGQRRARFFVLARLNPATVILKQYKSQ